MTTVAAREREAVYAGVRTRELVLDGDGLRFVLLHGFGDSLDTWRPFVTELAARGASAVAVDLPGFGAAADTLPGPQLTQLDRFVADLVRRNSDGRAPVLMGNSLGAALTVRAAGAAFALRGAIALSAPGDDFGRLVRALIWSRSPALHQRLGQGALGWFPMPRPLRVQAARLGLQRSVFHNPAMADRAAVQRVAGQIATGADLRRILRLLRRMLDEHSVSDYHPARISTPLLLVHGAGDALIPAHASVRLHGLVPGSRLEILPGCGHCPQLEMPARVAELAFRFLAQASQ